MGLFQKTRLLALGGFAKEHKLNKPQDFQRGIWLIFFQRNGKWS